MAIEARACLCSVLLILVIPPVSRSFGSNREQRALLRVLTGTYRAPRRAVVNEVSRTRDQLHPTPNHAGDQVQLVALPPVAQGQGCAWWAGPADAFAGVGKFSSTGRLLAPAQIGRFFQRLGSSGKLLGSYQAWVAA